MSVFYSIITALAGLGVLIFGIKTMNKGLENILGMGFKRALSSVSKNNFKSYGLGAGITALLQTSLLTNSMVCGLLNMGAIGLSQGMAISLGACVGSGVAVIIMAFQSIKLVQIFSVFTLIGVFVLIFAKNTKTEHIARTIIGFGCLCAGLTLISSGTGEITAIQSVSNFFSTLTNPVVLVLLGFALAIFMHSSMPVLALCIAFCGTADAVGPMSITSALLVVYGAHVGTSIIHIVLNGFGETPDSKRVLLFDFIVRFFAFLMFSLLLLTGWQNWLYSVCFSEASVTLVVAVLVLDIVPTLIVLPFIPLLEKLLRKIVRKSKKAENEFDVFELDEKTLALPGLAQQHVMLGITKILNMELGLFEKITAVSFDKNVEEKNFTNKFRAIEKVIKLSTNNVIRISGLQGANVNTSSGNLLDVLNDTNHILKALNRICDYGKDFRKKPKTLDVNQIQTLLDVAKDVNNLGTDVSLFISQNFSEQEKSEKLQMLFDKLEQNINLNAKAKKSTAKSKEKSESTLFLNILYELDKLNTDFINMAIKTNLMED